MNKCHKIIWCIFVNLSFVNSGTIFAGAANTEADVKLTDQIRNIIEQNQANFDSVRYMHGTVKSISTITYTGKGTRVLEQIEEMWCESNCFRKDTVESKFTDYETKSLLLSEDSNANKETFKSYTSGQVEIFSTESQMFYFPSSRSVSINPPKWKEKDIRKRNNLIKYQTILGASLKEKVLEYAALDYYFTVKSETMDGEECLLLESYIPKHESLRRIWIVPSKGYCIKKTQLFLEGELYKEYEVTLKEYQPGIWWFETVKAKEKTVFEQKNIEISVDSLTINEPIDPNIFTLAGTNIPSGTKVSNKITGERYTHVLVPPSLIGKPLPDFNDIKIKLSPADVVDKWMLVCFFDMEQRPSRNSLQQLSIKAQEYKVKDIVIVAVQASKVEKSKLDKWIREQDISFPVEMIENDEEKIRFSWGVRSLPWLILTDKKHIVAAEGFALTELDKKLLAK